MGKKTVNKKLKKKLERIRNQKNCIPPKIQANIWDIDNDGVEAYRNTRPYQEHVPIMERKGKLNKKPWYILTKKEHIAIDKSHKSTKMTRDDYIKGYIKQKMDKWELKHKKPQDNDLFYSSEFSKWTNAREEHHDRMMSIVSKKYIKRYTRPLVDYVHKSKHKYLLEYYAAKKAA